VFVVNDVVLELKLAIALSTSAFEYTSAFMVKEVLPSLTKLSGLLATKPRTVLLFKIGKPFAGEPANKTSSLVASAAVTSVLLAFVAS